MDTDYEREQREQREEERRQAELDRERRAEMAPAVPRTPRQRVEALICRAGEIGKSLPTTESAAPRLVELLRLLDRALVVLRDPHVVDGALLLCGKVEGAIELVEEGEYAGDALREVLELLSRPVYDDGDEIPVPVGDFEPDPNLKAKRQQVREVISRRTYEFGFAALSDEVVDALIHAVEAPF